MSPMHFDGCGARAAGAILLLALAAPGAAGQSLLHDFHGDAAGDELGRAVAAAGDVNGDGRADVIAGAAEAVGARGIARVVSGLDGSILHTFTGAAAGDHLGGDVRAAGDVDADGFDDVIAGASGDDTNGSNTGAAFVFSGDDGGLLHAFYGTSSFGGFGSAVAGAGDVDDDGHDDVVVGAWSEDVNGSNSGSVYVLSGNDGSLLHVFHGDSAGDGLGRHVSGAGDVDGDGHADVIASTMNTDYVRVWSGADGSVLHTFVDDVAGGFFGSDVAAAGDVDADGFDDVIVGDAQDDNANGFAAGRALVFSGQDGSLLYELLGAAPAASAGRSVGSGDLDGDAHADLFVFGTNDRVRLYAGVDGSLRLSLEPPAGQAWSAARPAGDVDGDGRTDLVTGNPFTDPNGPSSGSAWIYRIDGLPPFSCETFADAEEFEALFPGLAREDFDDANVAPGQLVTCADPVDSTGDGGACFDPGDLEPGLVCQSSAAPSADGLSVVGAGFGGGAHATTVLSATSGSTWLELRFPSGVRQIGVLVGTLAGASEVELEARDLADQIVFAGAVPASDVGAFFGIGCDGLVSSVRLRDPGAGAVFVDGLRFGSAAPLRCTTFTDAAVFDGLFSDLALEDFDDATPGVCDDPVPPNGAGCFPPGSLEPGVVLQSSAAPTSPGLRVVGPSGHAHATKVLSVAFDFYDLLLLFPDGARQIGFATGIVDFSADVRVSVFDVTGRHVYSATVPGPDVGAFWGIECNRPIGTVRLGVEPGVVEYVFADDLRFGDSERLLGTRLCSPNQPNSTGESGVVFVTGSSHDIDDDLTLTAVRLPTNPNIGYFLMGTGTNTFVPPGAGSSICIAPGLKRFHSPVDNTGEFPGGFDRVVGTQGNDHPQSVHITAGSSWSFQAWHRDSAAGISHLTDAVQVTFD